MSQDLAVTIAVIAGPALLINVSKLLKRFTRLSHLEKVNGKAELISYL